MDDDNNENDEMKQPPTHVIEHRLLAEHGERGGT
jgi:hypothetical protein